MGKPTSFEGIAFLNGFIRWLDTFTEMSVYVYHSFVHCRSSMAHWYYELDGKEGLRELIMELTCAFEKRYAGRTWDKDYSETLDNFLEEMEEKEGRFIR